MAKPLIVYRSLLRSSTATITDPGTATGFSIADIHDYRSYTLWKSNGTASPVVIDIDLGANPEAADSILLVNHNLSSQGAAVAILADTFTPPTTARGALVPAEDTVTYAAFTQTAALRYWRVSLAATFTAAPFIGELFLGLRLDLPNYLAPTFDPFFKQVSVQGSRSRGGHYLGASLRGETHRGTITFGAAGASRAAFTSDLNAFLDDHAYLRRPFGFVLDTADSDFAVARYLKVTDEGDIERRAVGGSWSNLTFELPVEEAYSEPV